jgi:hypothetical protein
MRILAVGLFALFVLAPAPTPAMPAGVYIDVSPIHGHGAFAGRAFRRGESVVVVVTAAREHVEDVSKWINHCGRAPSAEVAARGAEMHLVAKRSIRRGDELTVDYASPVTFVLADADGRISLAHMAPPEAGYTLC